MKPDSMFWIRICIVHSILVTWNDSTTAIIRRFFSESNDCWCGSKTTTKKHLKLTFCPKYVKTDLNQPNSKTTSTKQYLRRHLYTKSPSKNIFTKNKFKRNLHPKKSNCFLTWKTAKIEIDKNLKKRRCFIRFYQFRFLLCYLLCFFSRIFWWRCFFILFGRDFSSDVFFVEMSLQLFGTEMSLERCFGRDCSSDVYLAGNVSSKLPWYNFSR